MFVNLIDFVVLPTLQVSGSVGVRVFEGLDVDLVDWLLLPPLFGGRGGTLGRVDDDDDCCNQHGHPSNPKQHKQGPPERRYKVK